MLVESAASALHTAGGIILTSGRHSGLHLTTSFLGENTPR